MIHDDQKASTRAARWGTVLVALDTLEGREAQAW